jgi:hypothetical protein
MPTSSEITSFSERDLSFNAVPNGFNSVSSSWSTALQARDNLVESRFDSSRRCRATTTAQSKLPSRTNKRAESDGDDAV